MSNTYDPPVEDYLFLLDNLGFLTALQAPEQWQDLDTETAHDILTAAGKFCKHVVAPTNPDGDSIQSVLRNGRVELPPSFVKAYQSYVDEGWSQLTADPAYGGQGLPHTLGNAFQEMFQGANLALGLGPLLTHAAVDALATHGNDALKAVYLNKMVQGEWTGTMNLTEPQAGSDLGLLHSVAEPCTMETADKNPLGKYASDNGKGTPYQIKGQKIFITWGDQNATDNIVHFVLARLPNAPAGVKGISLFLVPKMLADGDGQHVVPNDISVLKLEEKLGIHGSPTCVMQYGERGGAIGWLIGEANAGLACMFTMMNAARIAVGVQGLGIAERAYQQAYTYAQERRQGNSPLVAESPAPIIYHTEIRRSLVTMRTRIAAMRGALVMVMTHFDLAKHAVDEAAQDHSEGFVNLFTPVIKAWFTDEAVQIATEALQVHGGMGFIEETGAAQHLRDARILPIYEGTNGIQARDLVGRKLIRDGGKVFELYVERLHALVGGMMQHHDVRVRTYGERLAEATDATDATAQLILDHASNEDMQAVEAMATAFLRQLSLLLGGEMIGRRLIAALNAPLLDGADGADAANAPDSEPAVGTPITQEQRKEQLAFVDCYLALYIRECTALSAVAADSGGLVFHDLAFLQV
ncbi:MAG: acyl-CoA dehydrogenase family protein [Alphaproteobacteria bacterium]|nr:acyl-CoA dehydrogenase family protein [Alphaproteobacteria bacterium]